MAAWVTLVMALAGCAAPAAQREAAAPEEEAPPVLPEAWRYACSDAAREVAPGVCADRVVAAGSGLGEPVVARSPADADVIAVAAMSTSPPSPAGPLPVRVLLFVSEDGGASWRQEEVPTVPAHASLDHIDPTIALEGRSTIHYSGLLESATENSAVFYVRSDDLGRTWSPPIVLSEDIGGTTDRSWLSLVGGVVAVTWQDFDIDAGLAWSADGGATWSTLRLPCLNTAPVTEHQGELLIGCREGDADGPLHGAVFALDLTAGTAERRGGFAGPCYYPALATTGGDRLAAVCMQGTWATSDDGGRTWEDRGSVLDLAAHASTWPGVEVTAVAPDARQGLHVLLAAREATGRVAPGTYAADLTPRAVAHMSHLVVDPWLAQPVQETVLTAEAAAQASPAPSGLYPPKDDFHGITVSPAGVTLAWTRDRGIDVTLAQPDA